MIPTGHFLIGGAIGAAASAQLAPPLAVPVALGCGILSHHLLDLLPHTDAATFWPDARKVPLAVAVFVGFEFALGAALVCGLYLSQHTTLAFLAGALGGILPDLLDEIPLWQQSFRGTALGAAWHRWHCRLHCSDMTANWVAGVVIDAVVIAVGLLYLLATSSSSAFAV